MKNKWLFYKIRDKQFPTMGDWWVLVINTPQRLVEYQQFKSKRLVESYFKGKKKVKEKQHLNGEESTMLQTIENTPNRKTVVDDINCISDTMLHPMTKFFLDEKIPLVNQVGGYRFLDNRVQVLEELEREEIIFPEDERLGIKISRWFEGKHYYAKVGQYDVKDEEGNLKWNTAQEAEKQAKKFKKKLLNKGGK